MFNSLQNLQVLVRFLLAVFGFFVITSCKIAIAVVATATRPRDRVISMLRMGVARQSHDSRKVAVASQL